MSPNRREITPPFAVLLILLGLAVAGCIGGDAPLDTPDDTSVPTTHPFPDGDEGWPLNLTGPFELGPKLTDPIMSHDGTPLESTIYVPDLPDGVNAPVVLWSQPYTGGCAVNGITQGCMPASDSDEIYTGYYSRLNPSVLVEHGFAVAVVNVRGTGNSGGCFEFGGLNEQKDQVALVEWLAEQGWSNGHVAMYGHSYHGWTPWMAAIQGPAALKTVIASGLVTDPYTFTYSPQGAPVAATGPFDAGFSASLNYIPSLGGGPQHALDGHAQRLPDRLCPGMAEVMSEPLKGQLTDFRDAAFWDERRLITHFADITTAVLVSHGFYDTSFQAGHSFQEDDVWHSLPADLPKRQIAGQWGHALPPPDGYIENAPFGSDWYEDTAVPWLDYWLKGVGDVDDLFVGTVHYQDQTNAWHETTAWPPAESHDEVLYLAPNGRLAADPAAGSRSFLSAGAVAGICDGTYAEPRTLLYVTEPLDEPVTLAGNPFAYLQVESTEPGGVVAVHVAAVDEDNPCAVEGPGVVAFAKGGADLRFHQGNYEGQDFPIIEATPVRIDVYNQAWRFEAGQRIGVLLSAGVGDGAHAGQPYTPLLTIHGGTAAGASHIVLPLAEGTLGGAAPSLEYPPQPFLPDGVG